MTEKRLLTDLFDDDEPVVSYDDYVLYGCDIASLREANGWLTDNVITFATKYLVNTIVRPVSLTTYKVDVISPALCEIIKVSDSDEIGELLRGAEVQTKGHYVFFLLSDRFDPHMLMGGTHWRFLCLSTDRRRFYFFDPADTQDMAGQRPTHDVIAFAERLKNFFDLSGDDIVERYITGVSMHASGECGVYVIEYIRVILKTLAENPDDGPINKFDFPGAMPLAYMKRVRIDWLNVIETVRSRQNIS